MNLFEHTLRFKGFPIVEAKKRLKEIQQIPLDDYSAYVTKLCNDIVEYHQRENEFYQSFTGVESFLNWEEVPVLQKSDLQQSLAGRLSNGFNNKNAYVNKTSGSSGHPFIFAKDNFCHALTWAEIIDRYSWYGLDLNRSLQARFYGIPLNKKGYVKERFKDRLSKRYRFPIFDLSEEKMEQFLKVFKRKRFTYINGYTSAIVLFAKFLQKKNIVLTTVCPSLQYCITTSEMLFDSDKTLLESVLGVPVVNEYGASELDLIAFTHPDGKMVVNSETLLVEILDDQDQIVPHGTPGRIVITSLYNRAHPMIRYDIGDTGILHPDSTLKKPILEKLVGRTNDVAKLPDGRSVPGLTFYYVTKSVIEDDGNVKEFVVEQTALDTFRILYVSESALTSEAIKRIEKGLYRYLEKDLTLEFERKVQLDRSARGKLKQFVSLLDA